MPLPDVSVNGADSARTFSGAALCPLISTANRTRRTAASTLPSHVASQAPSASLKTTLTRLLTRHSVVPSRTAVTFSPGADWLAACRAAAMSLARSGQTAAAFPKP